MSKECIIGLLYDYDNTKLVTLDELSEYCEQQAEVKAYAEKLGLDLRRFTMREYADRRKGTNLKRFCHCPDCGAIIDWGEIKKYAGTD